MFLGILIALCGVVGNGLAAQFGNFTYTDNGSDIFITGYPRTLGGALVIPASINGKPVKIIGPQAFSYCNKLTSVTFPASLTTISSDAFTGCTGITGILILPASLTRIDQNAFRFCSGLTGALTLPAGLRSVGSGAFASCSRITSIFIPAQLTGIFFPGQINGYNGVAAFSSCNALQSISVDAANPYYSSSNGVLFQKFDSILMKYPAAKSGSYVVPSNTKQIGNTAFEGCRNLTSVSIPSGVTTLGYDAFSGCTGLTSVVLPNTVTSIGARCFWYASNLRSVSIPSSVKTIRSFAFSGCTSLEGVTLPASVTSMEEGVFAGCSKLTSIAVKAGNPKFVAVAGVVFDITQTKLIQFPSGRAGSYSVPAGVTEIFGYAFRESRELTAVKLPTNLEIIATGAFSHCSKLIDIPLPPHLTTIGDHAFDYCGALVEVRIPQAVTKIGIGAFSYCSQLKSAEFRGDAPTMGSGVFTGTASDFEVRYYNDRADFTTPTWLDFPAVNLGDYVARPPQIAVLDNSGNELPNLQSIESFGNLTVGQNSTLNFTLKNSGETDLTNISVAISGPNATDFQITPIDTTTLWEGESTFMKVSFHPTTAGVRTAKLQISSNDSDENPFEIQLEGTGTVPPAPEITVTQPVDTVLVDASSKKSFGTMNVGEKSTAMVFTITNDGTAILTDLILSADGNHANDFTFNQPRMTSLAPGTSTTFEVAFQPTGNGARSATIHLHSNDTDENPFDIQLAGTGSVPLSPEITVRQASGSILMDGAAAKSFGKVKLGKKSSGNVFTITNVGKADLTGLFLSANGSDARDFKFSQPAKKSLPPGASTKFKVTFKPKAKGNRSAAVHLRSNDLDESPFDIKLKGKGVK